MNYQRNNNEDDNGGKEEEEARGGVEKFGNIVIHMMQRLQRERTDYYYHVPQESRLPKNYVLSVYM